MSQQCRKALRLCCVALTRYKRQLYLAMGFTGVIALEQIQAGSLLIACNMGGILYSSLF